MRQELASLDVMLQGPARPVGAYALVGVGLYHLHVVGSAEVPDRAARDDVFGFAARLGAGALLRVGARVALRAEVSATLLLPRPGLLIGESRAGRAGAPSVGLGLGVVVGL